jgi:peptidoglycan/xylan/chitin deacetylase (PgdA/CDA1 family)
MARLAEEIGNDPVLLPLLDRLKVQGTSFTPTRYVDRRVPSLLT